MPATDIMLKNEHSKVHVPEPLYKKGELLWSGMLLSEFSG